MAKRQKAHMVYLFTNRNCLVFDKKGEQIGELQRGVSCYQVNKKIAQTIADEGEQFRYRNLENGTIQLLNASLSIY